MLALAGAALMPATVFGQTNDRHMGFKVGLVTSSTEPVHAPDFPDTAASTGLTAGAIGRLPAGGRLAVQGELNYARLGMNVEDAQVRSDRIQVPVLVQYVLADARFGLRAFAGPMIDLELSCSTRVPLSTDSGGDAGSVIVPSCPFDANAGGLSLVVGGLVDVPVGSYLLTFDVRYNHGLDRMETRGSQPDYRGFHGLAATIGFGFRSPWT